MNDERVPINLYKLDSGYNDKGMDGKELIKDYKQNIQKWCFIAVADIAVITVFINFKAPDTVMMSLVIYIAALALLTVSIIRLRRYHLQYRNINDDIQK